MTPRLLTSDLATKIKGLLRSGHYRQTVALACGVHPRTLSRWLQAGDSEWAEAERLALEADDASVQLTPIAEFARACMMMEGQAEIEKIESMADGEDARKIAEFFLSRRYPRRWGRAAERVDVEVTGSVHVDVDPREALLRRLAATAIGGGTKTPDQGDDPG